MSTYYAPITGTRIRPTSAHLQHRRTCRRCGIDFALNSKTGYDLIHCKDCRYYNQHEPQQEQELAA